MPVTYADEIKKIKTQNLYRQLKQIKKISSTKGIIDSSTITFFSSNDYLGLSDHPKIKEVSIKATQKYGTSATASRLINGNYHLYQELEAKISHFKGKEAALTYPTGYMANLGLISALASKNDVIYLDKLNHASLYDGCKLSSAKIRRYPHLDLDQLKSWLKTDSGYRQRFIVTDGVFSMDGDIAPLYQLKKIATKYDCLLIVDDAHGTGVLGKNGKGSCNYLKTEVSVEMSTLSKALGSLGGFIAADKELIDYLVNKSRPFMFTTGLPPSILAATIEAIEIIEKEPWRQKRVLELAGKARKTLGQAGYRIPKGFTPIIPLIIDSNGSEKKAVELSKKCLDKGIFIPAIRTPAVNKSEARLRMTVSAAHTNAELKKALEILIFAGKELDVIE